MKKIDIVQMITILANIGVIVTLLFVGYEVSQNTRVARGEARQALADLNQEWLVLLSQDSEFNTLWNKVWLTHEELSPAEWSRGKFMMLLHLRRIENVYFHWDEGLVDESALHSYGLQRAEYFKTDRFNQFWFVEDWRAGFDDDFVDFLEEKLELRFDRNM